MNFTSYTLDEFIEIIPDLVSREEMIERMSTYNFTPRIVVTWNIDREAIGDVDWERDQKIDQWFRDNCKYMVGQAEKHWRCQIEFECEEDAMAFKLMWTE